MFEIHPPQALLEVDPDLGQLLSEERRRRAGAELEVAVATIAPGDWTPDALLSPRRASNVGLLVLDGAVVRGTILLDCPSAELLGPGDIIRTWRADPAPQPLRPAIEWRALERTTVAVLDGATALTLRVFPEIMAVVLDRIDARAERLAVTQAISQITGVETRIEALLWHLSHRWGRVTRDGVIVALALSHRLLGALVGARRPTVSTAVARLAEDGRVERRSDGLWLLTGSGPRADGAEASLAA
ncbi:helix-turn-helix domain-containing protein [Solirubrobacter soli]|uniref:helix-turn-helix domain-containing protein n=1 Tax=Solirubrobacter soli TaxID=363832 RepID=UPI0003F836FF|nr:helix-turn-helix domain-containing protein [Solirubrobacter soli]